MTSMGTYFRDYLAVAKQLDDNLDRVRRVMVDTAQVTERSAEEAATLIAAARWGQYVDAVGLPFAEACQRFLEDHYMAINYYAFRCPDPLMIAPS